MLMRSMHAGWEIEMEVGREQSERSFHLCSCLSLPSGPDRLFSELISLVSSSKIIKTLLGGVYPYLMKSQTTIRMSPSVEPF